MQTVTVKADMCSTVLIYYKTRNKIFGECASFRRTCIWIRASYKGRIWTGENIDWIRSTSVITVVHSASANLRGGGDQYHTVHLYIFFKSLKQRV